MTEEDKPKFSEVYNLFKRAQQQFIRVWYLYEISDKCNNLVELGKQHPFLAVLISSFIFFSVLPTLIFMSMVIGGIGFGLLIFIITEGETNII